MIQFHRDRSLAGNHVRIVVGRDVHPARFPGRRARSQFGIQRIAAHDVNFSAAVSNGFQLFRRDLRGDVDLRPNPQGSCGGRHCQAMITGRRGKHTGPSLLGTQHAKRIGSAAELEGSRALLILELELDERREVARGMTRTDNRCLQDDRPDSLVGRQNCLFPVQGDSAHSLRKTSKSPAAPMPPPTHMVMTTYLSLRRRPSSSAWPTILAPLMP